MIFDRQYTPIIFEHQARLSSGESVYACRLQCKQEINAGEVAYARGKSRRSAACIAPACLYPGCREVGAKSSRTGSLAGF